MADQAEIAALRALGLSDLGIQEYLRERDDEARRRASYQNGLATRQESTPVEVVVKPKTAKEMVNEFEETIPYGPGFSFKKGEIKTFTEDWLAIQKLEDTGEYWRVDRSNGEGFEPRFYVTLGFGGELASGRGKKLSDAIADCLEEIVPRETPAS